MEDMPKAPNNFPKCGNYMPPVSNEPMYTVEHPQRIIPLGNGSTPKQPPYSIVQPTVSLPDENLNEIEQQNSTKATRRPGRYTGSVGSTASAFGIYSISILIVTSIVTLGVEL